jgi:hypothetical protein
MIIALPNIDNNNAMMTEFVIYIYSLHDTYEDKQRNEKTKVKQLIIRSMST